MITLEKELNRLLALDEILQGVNQFTNEELRNELNAKLERLYPNQGYAIAQRTFEGLLAYLKEQGAPLKRGRSGRHYTRKWSIVERLFGDYSPTRMNLIQLYQAYIVTKQFQYFSVVSQVWEDKYKLKEQFEKEGFKNKPYVQFDFKSNIRGLEKVEPLLEHIVQKERLRIEYRKFEWDHKQEEKVTIYDIDPYFIKEYRDIWYLVGFKVSGDKVGVRVFALDRIQTFRTIGRQDPKPAIDIEKHFEHTVGLRWAEKKPQQIKLIANHMSAHYIRLRPLVPDYEEEQLDHGDVLFTFTATVNMELENEILWWGPGIEIVAPDILRESLKERVTALYDTYHQ